MSLHISPRALRAALAAALPAIALACSRTPVVTVPSGTAVAGNSFVVRDVRVFDGARAIDRTNVVVRDGRITSVGRSVPRDLPAIDGTGRTLLPGLIDTHGHVHNDAALRDALRFGVTTVLDMLSRAEVIQAHKARRSRIERTDLADLWSAALPITSPRGLGTQFGIPFETLTRPEDAAAQVRARVAAGSDYIKILYEPGAPLFTTISRDALAAVVAAAHAEGVMALVHVSSLQGARDAVAVGADGLAHGFSDLAADDSLVREMARRGTFVVATLSMYGALRGRGVGAGLVADARVAPYLTPAQRTALLNPGPGADSPMAPYLARFDIDLGAANVRRLRAAGVKVLVGTDAGTGLAAHGASVHGELEALVRAGMTPAEALTAATLATAEAFRLIDRGRIAVGAKADMLLVEGNPLEDIRRTRGIERVFRNGYQVERTAR